MLWIILTLGCALFASLSAITQKKVLQKQHAMEFITVFAILNSVLSLFLLPFVNFSFPLYYLIVIYIISWVGTIPLLLFAKALRHTEISKTSPILNIEPVILAVLAFFLLSEKLALTNYLGIALIMFASNFLGEEKYYMHPIKHLRHFRHSKYSLFAFGAVIAYAVCAILDKTVLNMGVSPVTYIFLIHCFQAVNYLILLTIFHDGFKGVTHGVKTAGKWILLVAVLTTTARVLQMHAVSIAMVSLVIPIKRLSTLFSVVIGGRLFKEKRIMQKSIACLVMILGAILVIQ